MSPLAIFEGPWGWAAKWGVIAALVAAFGAWAWFKGNEHGTQKLIDYQAAQAIEATRINTARAVVTTKEVIRYVKIAGATQTVTETVEKEVIKYADQNTGVCLDADWRRLHDAAALNTVPAPAGGVPSPGGAPKAATALDTVTGNYAACHRNADRLDFILRWLDAQEAVK